MQLGAKIRETRENQGITLRKLAKDIGVSPSFISQVEQNKANPSIDSLKQIAALLGVTCSYLIGESSGDTANIVERPVSNKNQFDLDKLHNVTVKKMVPENVLNSMEPCLLTLEPGAYSNEDMHGAHGEEFLLVLSGQLNITLNQKEYVLRDGDNIFFNATVKHSFRNKSEEPARILCIKKS